MRISRIAGASPAAAAALLVLALGCGGGRTDPAAIHFADVTEAMGIARSAPNYDAAIGDFDGDGWPDLWVGNHEGTPALLRNEQGRSFRDVFAASGIDPVGDHHGAAWTDVDGDGKLDLYLGFGAFRGQGEKANPLYRNLGDGRFERVAASAGVDDPRGRARAAASFDYDRDGRLDLLMANFASPTRLFRNRGDGSYEDVSEAAGVAGYTAELASWTDYDGDGDPDLVFLAGPKGLRLLRNDDGRFVDVTEQAGIDPWIGAGGVAFGDYDGDGLLDLFVNLGWSYTSNVHEAGDGVVTFALLGGEFPRGVDFETEGEAGLQVEAELYQRGAPAPPAQLRCGAEGRPSGHRFTCGGDQAVAATPPAVEPSFALWREPEGKTPCAGCATVWTWHLRWFGSGDWNETGILRGALRPKLWGVAPNPKRGGVLYRNRGSTFERVAPDGLAPRVNGQGATWVDVDDDGWLDLYVVDAAADGVPAQSQLFLNDRGRGFVAVPPESGATPRITTGRPISVHAADFDGDGRVDLFSTNGWGAPPFNRGPYLLLRNESPQRHWLEVSLTGTASNRLGLGAWVEVAACGRRQVRLHDGGRSDLSQSVARPHFGLGDCSEIDSVRVRWPSGRESELRDVVADRVLAITEGDA